MYKIDVKPTPKAELHESLYRDVLAKIISGELAPGQRLIEEDLARAYKVSRTPIREVLMAFQKDGLVERVRNCGARVVSFTADDIEELFDIRRALEVHCIPNVVRTIKLNALLELERRIEAVGSTANPDFQEKHAAIDLELHQLIISHSGNNRLIAYMNALSLLRESLQLASFSDADHVRDTGEQHLAIIRAIARRDVESAQRLLAEHIEYGKRNAVEMFIRRRRGARVLAQAGA